ncbi:MAG: Rpn family recombination-promoting nuclease/putative transposase [Treponema sp.]|nr:Rpn family recombination-promoting nuclease/putative transposase [Candidatus Treponema scatequi]
MSELILAPDELIEKWNNLPFSNNFIFTKVMQNEEICKHTLELLLNIKIKKLEYTHSEVYFKDSIDSHGIRLDVYTTDEKHCYDIEMQTTNKPNLLKRARFYSSCIDVDSLKQGKNYSELKENIIIFLCLEDPFNKNYQFILLKPSVLKCLILEMTKQLNYFIILVSLKNILIKMFVIFSAS